MTYDPMTNRFGHGDYLADRHLAGDAIRFDDCVDFFDQTPQHAFLSNFYPSPIRVDVGWGVVDYATGEHAFAAAKARTEAEHAKIATADSPGMAKAMGRRTRLRPDWEDIKVDVMRRVLEAKFPSLESDDLTVALLATGNQVLIEGNTWGDRIWGVAYDSISEVVRGENLLGVLLMERRGYLRHGLLPAQVRCPLDEPWKRDG